MIVVAFVLASEFCRADDYAYIERWETGTLTTGEPFESWRIHVVIPEDDDWRVSGIDAWLTGGPTWYYNWDAGGIPDPDLFDTYPDAEFTSYFTAPHLYPNSGVVEDDLIFTPDSRLGPTYLHLGSWADPYIYTGGGDYVVFQGTALNPIAGAYGLIEFFYTTELEFDPQYFTFVIPEPMTGMLLVLGACTLLRRRG